LTQIASQDGYKTAQELSAAGVPAEIVHDVAVGFVMQEADIVLTGIVKRDLIQCQKRPSKVSNET
jgi:hypothetical protein